MEDGRKLIFRRWSCYHAEDWIDPFLSQNILCSYAVSSTYSLFLPSPPMDSTKCSVMYCVVLNCVVLCCVVLCCTVQ